MNTDQRKSGVAQPADEELKKHGDPLERQVKDAAGKPLPDSDQDKPEPVQRGQGTSSR